jgi:hypothetical protein
VRKLRRRPCGRSFRDACDAALDCGYAELEEAAAERAKNGIARPIFHKGEQVGEWRHHDERLTMFLLRFRRPHRFGQDVDRPVVPAPNIPGYAADEQIAFDPEVEFDGCLDALDCAPEPPPEEEERCYPDRACDSGEE